MNSSKIISTHYVWQGNFSGKGEIVLPPQHGVTAFGDTPVLKYNAEV